MYKITCTNENVFGEEKFNNDYRERLEKNGLMKM